jgi:cyclophilin family peptidyl-prolyl cis-trans isomerase
MAEVFISYAREDREPAERLAHAIESRGWSVWWDRRIPAGQSYEDVIEQEIDAASCVVVLWTRTSVVSEWVRNEAREGARRRILIPIRLEDVRLPLAFRHLQADDLLGWSDAELENCLDSIGVMIGAPVKRPVVEAPLPPPPELPPAEKPPAPAPPPVAMPAAMPARKRTLNWRGIAIAVFVTVVVAIVLSTLPWKKAENVNTDTAAVDTSMPTTEIGTATTTSGTMAPEPARVADVAVFSSATDTTATATRAIAVSTQIVDLETTAGTITIELFPEVAPKHAENFLRIARSGGFDGTRVLKIFKDGFSAGRDAGATIRQEPNDIAFTRGTVIGMNKNNELSEIDITDAFYIGFKNSLELSRKHNTAFGRVIAGMDVVDAIMKIPHDKNNDLLTPITIKRAVVRNRS